MLQFLVKRSYSDVRFLNTEGDYEDDHGWTDEGSLLSFADTIDELRGCMELSLWPATAENCAHSWAVKEEERLDDGWTREENVHVHSDDGSQLPSRSLYRLYRAAGLTK